MTSNNSRDAILLFDVDGTLTPSRLDVTEEMAALLKELRKYYYIGIVGGSDFRKQQEQLTLMGDILKEFDYVFSENGLDAYQNGELIARQNIAKYFGEENLKKIINFTLRALSEIDCPVKRGNFIEYRNGMLNVCPVGRSCSQIEREEFEQYDKVHGIRPALAAKLEEQFKELKLRCAIGGQISIDVFPEGWDKTYCLRYVEKQFPKGKIHFFGDKTMKGGNDYEIYSHPNVIGHSVKTWQETYKILKEEFLNSKLQ